MLRGVVYDWIEVFYWKRVSMVEVSGRRASFVGVALQQWRPHRGGTRVGEAA